MTNKWRHDKKQKFQNFKKIVSKANSFLQISGNIWWWSSYYWWYIFSQDRPFFTQFWNNDVKKLINFLKQPQNCLICFNNVRSSCPEVFCKKDVLRNIVKFTGKHLCQGLLFNKFAKKKKRFWHRCFPVNFAKFLRTSFLYNTSGGCFWNVYGSSSTEFQDPV